MKDICIKEDSICLGREKFPINGKIFCCKEEKNEEFFIAQSVIDAIEDCTPTTESISRVCSRISFAANTISPENNYERLEIFPELKRFSALAYAHKDRILNEIYIQDLTCSFVQVVKTWFTHSFIYDTEHNIVESIKADLQTLEMSLGVCMLLPYHEDELDDIFF